MNFEIYNYKAIVYIFFEYMKDQQISFQFYVLMYS